MNCRLDEARQIAHSKGDFSGYFVEGFKYDVGNGVTGWHTTSYGSDPLRNPVRNYWVQDRTLYDFRLGLPGAPSEIGPKIENYDPAEYGAVLEAIEEWEAHP
jgi:hypothetical protein